MPQQHEMEVVAPGVAGAKPSAKPAAAAAAEAATASDGAPLFEEFYDDWAAFDAAVARAVARHHPIRKRSSLTFEVYNRTVSKGKHDRRRIAEFLSKTFKCTHGIKFRSRSSGKRSRHTLRDIGCPFHLYASAVEFGPTYRVKVRSHDAHNHPIGPDAMKAFSARLKADGERALKLGATASSSLLSPSPSPSTTTSATAAAATTVAGAAASSQPSSAAPVLASVVSIGQLPEPAATPPTTAAAAAPSAAAEAQTAALGRALAQAQAQALLRAQEQARALSTARAQAHAALPTLHQPTPAPAPASAALLAHGRGDSDRQAHSPGELLDGGGHDSEALLARAIESSIDAEAFISRGPASAAPSATAASSSPSSSDAPRPASAFEPTMTLEAVRKRVAAFAEARDWDQVHTPRNLLLALSGQVGELCEMFRWKGECKDTDDWAEEEKARLGEELSAVLVHLVRLADKCHIDLPATLDAKMAKDGAKYPVGPITSAAKKSGQHKRMRVDKEFV